MDDITSFLRSAGVPAGFITVGACAFYLADKIRIWERPARKTDREQLSDDQRKFWDGFKDRLETVEQGLATCEDNHRACQEDRIACVKEQVECERRQIKLVAWANSLQQQFIKAGFDLEPLPEDLLKLGQKVDSLL